MTAVQVLRTEPLDLDSFTVRRLLPHDTRASIGPFVFYDHMGPAEMPIGAGIDVRPHPHVGLATLTYLFDGEIMHRDSLGTAQPIRPGAINWMTAGRGIVHSERTPPEVRAKPSRLHGIQTWLALPAEHEDAAPAFVHVPADSVPHFERDGMRIAVVAGAAFGVTSPVQTYSKTLYLVADLAREAIWHAPNDVRELAIHVAIGRIRVGETTVVAGEMAVLDPRQRNVVVALEPSKVVAIGGDPLGPRLLWWNFVTTTAERMSHAKARWRDGGFERVAGDAEFIPLPADEDG